MASKKEKANVTAPAKTGRRKSVWIIAGSIVLAAVIVVAAVIMVRDNKIRERDRLMVEGEKDTFTLVSKSVQDFLDNKNVGSASVYDSAGTLLFTVRDTQGIAPVGTVPTELKTELMEALVGIRGASKIDLDKWSNSHTVLGGSSNTSIESLSAGSLGWKVVDCWCEYNNVTMTAESRLIVAASLDSKYSTDQLFDYVVAASMFGGNRGVTTAAESFFGKNLSQLSVPQREYLVYSLNNLGATWDDFKEKNPDSLGGAKSAEDFGFVENTGTDWLIRRSVQAELAQVLGTSELKQDYNVRLKLNPRIQKDLQAAVDSGMSASITLDSAGQTVLNGTAVVVDSRTGYVLACVGGRSRNTAPKELIFRESSDIGVYEAARQLFAGDPKLAYNTMLSYDTLSGQPEVGTLSGIVHSGKLSLLGVTPVVESTIRLGEVSSFLSGMYRDKGPRFIEQVKTTTGSDIYTAPPAADMSGKNNNADLRCLFAGTSDTNAFDYIQVVDSGLVMATACDEFIVAGLYGTTAQGYKLSDSDYAMCEHTAAHVLEAVTKYFQIEPDSIDPDGVVAGKAKEAKNSNAEFVSKTFDTWVEDLKEMPINSPETGAEFNNAFAYYASLVDTYQGVIDDDLLQKLADKLSAVRVDRSDELLKYAS